MRTNLTARLPSLALIVVAPVLSIAITQAQAPQAASMAAPKTVWNGVYSDAQATRGKEAYMANCLQCHGEDLAGGSDPSGDAAGTALVGSNFWNSWGDDTLGSLLGLMRSRMPLDSPGSLDQDVYLSILAFILQSNEFPSGPSALTADTVAGIRVAAKDGKPIPVRDFTLVRVVGCLTQPARGKWSLTQASDPMKTKDPKSEEPVPVEMSGLGARTFELEDIYADPSAHVGRKVEVRGFLLTKTPTGDRVNITSLRMIDPTCQK